MRAKCVRDQKINFCNFLHGVDGTQQRPPSQVFSSCLDGQAQCSLLACDWSTTYPIKICLLLIIVLNYYMM